MKSPTTPNTPYALPAAGGKPMAWFGSTIILKASSPDLGVTDVTIRPGEEPPLHVHRNEDEWFYLISGNVTFHVGDQNFFGEPGAFVSFPRGIPHTFSIEADQAQFLVMNTPGGFEKMFERAPKSPEEAVAAMTALGMEVVGPHPRQANTRAALPVG